MRVLHLVAARRFTGAAATALQAVQALRASGVECHLAFTAGDNLEARLAGCEWSHPHLRKVARPRDLAASVRAVRRLAARADLVHVHLPQDHLLAVAAGVPTVVRSIHHPAHLAPNPYYRLLLRGVQALGLASASMARLVPPRLGRRVAVGVLPVALEPRFCPGDDRPVTRRRLGVPIDATVVGTIGKLDAGRGHDLFIRALGRCPGVWGMVIGHGPLAGRLASLAREVGVQSRLVWPGYVEEGLESLYRAMDLFVFPAAGSDWAHRAIAEAAGCGVGALAADLLGVRDLVTAGVTGDLFPPGDSDALAALIADWVSAPGRCREAGAAAAARAAREWTPAHLATACLELYRNAASRGGTRADPGGS